MGSAISELIQQGGYFGMMVVGVAIIIWAIARGWAKVQGTQRHTITVPADVIQSIEEARQVGSIEHAKIVGGLERISSTQAEQTRLLAKINDKLLRPADLAALMKGVIKE